MDGESNTTYPPSRLLHLIEKLPEGSEFHCLRSGTPIDGRDWGLVPWLLAAVINALNSNTVATIAVAGGKPPKFEPVQGPVPVKKREPVTIDSLFAALSPPS